jgi:hypothetical protein
MPKPIYESKYRPLGHPCDVLIVGAWFYCEGMLKSELVETFAENVNRQGFRQLKLSDVLRPHIRQE